MAKVNRRVVGFLIDDLNEEKMAIHGLTPERILEVLDRPFLMVGNRKGRRASHLIVGRDRTGACISIPVEATAERGIWRPVTAWSCKVHELRKLEQEEN